MPYIYQIVNNINQKVYVGKTNFSIEKRWKEHIHDSKKEDISNRPLYKAMNKYGFENFSIEVLEEVSLDEVNEKEIYWIEKLGSFKHGYNATKGGDGTHYLDYELIIKTYNEVKSAAKVAEILKIDQKHILKIIKEYNNMIYSKTENAKIAVAMLDKNTEEILRIFSSIKEAENFVGCKGKGHISAVCKGKRKTTMGYKWKYL